MWHFDVTNAPIPLGYDLFPTMPTFADLGTYTRAATIVKNGPFLYSDYAVVTLDTLQIGLRYD